MNDAMTHAEIDDRQVVEHYVTGKLSDDDAARFEEHYLGCPACVRAVEDAECLARGLRAVAAEAIKYEAQARQTALAAAWRVLRSRSGGLLAAALVVVALLPAGLAWQRAERLDTELGKARQEIEQTERPRLNTPILTLAATRAGEQPLQRISLATEPEWVVLAVELGEDAGNEYAVTITAADGAEVLAAEGLAPDYRGTVTLMVLSTLLPPGDYVLELRAGGETWRFPIRTVPFP